MRQLLATLGRRPAPLIGTFVALCVSSGSHTFVFSSSLDPLTAGLFLQRSPPRL